MAEFSKGRMMALSLHPDKVKKVKEYWVYIDDKTYTEFDIIKSYRGNDMDISYETLDDNRKCRIFVGDENIIINIYDSPDWCRIECHDNATPIMLTAKDDIEKGIEEDIENDIEEYIEDVDKFYKFKIVPDRQFNMDDIRNSTHKKIYVTRPN